MLDGFAVGAAFEARLISATKRPRVRLKLPEAIGLPITRNVTRNAPEAGPSGLVTLPDGAFSRTAVFNTFGPGCLAAPRPGRWIVPERFPAALLSRCLPLPNVSAKLFSRLSAQMYSSQVFYYRTGVA